MIAGNPMRADGRWRAGGTRVVVVVGGCGVDLRGDVAELRAVRKLEVELHGGRRGRVSESSRGERTGERRRKAVNGRREAAKGPPRDGLCAGSCPRGLRLRGAGAGGGGA